MHTSCMVCCVATALVLTVHFMRGNRKAVVKKRLYNMPGKMRGHLRGGAARPSLKYTVWGCISGIVSILAIFAITELVGHPLLIGSFGASAVLLFGATESPLAQPRNLVGGHLVSAIVAVTIVAFGGSGPLAFSLAVGLSILLMSLTRTIHPPGGATALIGVQGHVGVEFIFAPVLVGVLILLAVALFSNNMVHHRQYPKHWI
jgi:CBS-domain-containing membrane protein